MEIANLLQQDQQQDGPARGRQQRHSTRSSRRRRHCHSARASTDSLQHMEQRGGCAVGSTSSSRSRVAPSSPSFCSSITHCIVGDGQPYRHCSEPELPPLAQIMSSSASVSPSQSSGSTHPWYGLSPPFSPSSPLHAPRRVSSEPGTGMEVSNLVNSNTTAASTCASLSAPNSARLERRDAHQQQQQQRRMLSPSPVSGGDGTDSNSPRSMHSGDGMSAASYGRRVLAPPLSWETGPVVGSAPNKYCGVISSSSGASSSANSSAMGWTNANVALRDSFGAFDMDGGPLHSSPSLSAFPSLSSISTSGSGGGMRRNASTLPQRLTRVTQTNSHKSTRLKMSESDSAVPAVSSSQFNFSPTRSNDVGFAVSVTSTRSGSSDLLPLSSQESLFSSDPSLIPSSTTPMDTSCDAPPLPSSFPPPLSPTPSPPPSQRRGLRKQRHVPGETCQQCGKVDPPQWRRGVSSAFVMIFYSIYAVSLGFMCVDTLCLSNSPTERQPCVMLAVFAMPKSRSATNATNSVGNEANWILFFPFSFLIVSYSYS